MLKELKIENLVLVEKETLTFEQGLNVLSGETGAGKSAIMEALNLLLGGRSDHLLIRKGAERSIVEAIFTIEHLSQLKNFLESCGIDHEDDENLVIRREISVKNSGKVYLNHQLAQISLLRKVGEYLMEIVAQHASQKLTVLENHRHFLDLYGNLKEDVQTFSQSFEEEKKVSERIQHLIGDEASRLREMDLCRMEIEELELAHLKEGEEENLFESYSLLTNAEERKGKVNQILDFLAGEKGAALSALKKCQIFFEQLTQLDKTLNDSSQLLKSAQLEVEEVIYALRIYATRIDTHPEKIDKINQRLTLINQLKRKYGSSVQEINAYLAKRKLTLASLENGDQQIEQLQHQYQQLLQVNEKMARHLTNKRVEQAQLLGERLTKELKDLHMPNAEIQIEITPLKRNATGDDQVQFFLIPNTGEHKVALKNCASGGEMSRFMLAMQALLAGKDGVSTLVFDEIDGNIGGKAAVVVGQKLKEIGLSHQVICITHFPQVAQFADHHIQIRKETRDGRTFTVVNHLDEHSRKEELARMQGI